MKKLLPILIILFFSFTFAQEITYVKLDYSCEAGIAEAKKDIESGKLKYLSYGLILRNDSDLYKFHCQFVKEKYGVEIGDGGCVISDKTECYGETMKQAILKKFGEDFFERVHSESEEAYPESDYFKEEILPKIESEEFMIYGSVQDSVINEFISQNIDLSQLEKRSTVNLSYILDKDGYLSDIKVTDTNNITLADLIVKTLEKFPQQTPGKYFGYVINTKKRTYFEFLPTNQ